MMVLVTPQISTILPASTVNPFDDEVYKACWFEHLSGYYGVKARYGDFTLHHVPLFKGLVQLKELRLYATQSAWFQDLTERRAHDFSALTQQVNWDAFIYYWADSRQHLQAIEHLAQLGYPMLQSRNTPMHVVDISQGFEAYLASRNAKDRYNIKQKLREAHRCELFTYDRFDDIDPFFEQAFSLHMDYWGAKIGHSFFKYPETRAFAVAWAKEMFKKGQARLHGLKVDGELANLSSSFYVGNTMFWGLTINTGAKQDVFPGLISLYMRLDQAAQEGAELFNMQYCELPFKRQVRTHEDKRHVLVVTNPNTITGRLAHAHYQRKYKATPLPLL